RLADGEIREERMSRLDRRLLALYLRPGVGLVELDVLDVATEGGVDAALAALLQALEDVVLHLHVPGVVVLARLEHGTRRRDGVGVLKTILMVWLSSLSMRAMSRYWPEAVAAVAESAEYSQLKTTSSAVNGLPSCHVAFFWSRQVTDRPSLATSPFCKLGTS